MLLAAARAEFVERGFHNANVHRICERASMGIGSFYERFAGKAELLLAVMELWVGDFLAGLQSASASRADMHRSFDTLLTDAQSTALRRAWREAATSEASVREAADRLRGEQLRRVADLITSVRASERVSTPMLSATEAAWLIFLVMRDGPLEGDLPDSASLMHRVLDLAIGEASPAV